jgi:hypothetical protein
MRFKRAAMEATVALVANCMEGRGKEWVSRLLLKSFSLVTQVHVLVALVVALVSLSIIMLIERQNNKKFL